MIQIYNTQTHKKENLKTREEGKVRMYACGPTVYNHIHIGNARTFLTFDVVRRWLEWRGMDVTFVQNITDVDDKIINRANEEGKTAADVAADYTEKFISAMHEFGIKDPDVRPKATEEIPEMINLVERLIEGGHAYEVEGDVYFSVRSFSQYGKLSGRNIDDLQSGARVDVDERKRDPLDFALWKAAKPGEPHWTSPWGEGRPGWHLECSAMSEKYLGLPIDIHGGGSDLVFPHHENEIAQSEAATGCTFSTCWLHGGMLRINEEKMSKSLGNFMLLKDVLAECDPQALRLLMLQTHYRSPLDFSDTRLTEATQSLERIKNCVHNMLWALDVAAVCEGPNSDAADNLNAACASMKEKFEFCMDDDFNTAGALGAVFGFVGRANAFVDGCSALSEQERKGLDLAAKTVIELMGVLGIDVSGSNDEDAPCWPKETCELAAKYANYEGTDAHKAADALLCARTKARASKNWEVADAIRDGLGELGFVIEDTTNGARISFEG